jgi:hypothetical protein
MSDRKIRYGPPSTSAERPSGSTKQEITRRALLVRAAVLASAAGLPVVARAQDPRVVVDGAALNFILKFEYVQEALYNAALARLLPRDFAPYGAGVYDTVALFREQEASHVATLIDLVRRLSLTPLPQCETRFTRFRNAQEFFRVALVLENIGVSAYLGVLPLLRTPQLQTGIASISSVESRHAAFMGLMNGESPAPAPADTPRSREVILGLLDPYIGSCDAQQ